MVVGQSQYIESIVSCIIAYSAGHITKEERDDMLKLCKLVYKRTFRNPPFINFVNVGIKITETNYIEYK